MAGQWHQGHVCAGGWEVTNPRNVVPGYIDTLLNERWIAAGKKPDTTMEIEERKGHHWLVTPTTTRPAISTFLKTVMRHQKWTQTAMARLVGMNVCNVNRLVMGGQQSCAPETKAKFERLVADIPPLRLLCEQTDWGLSAEPNRTLALEKQKQKGK